MEGLLSIAYVLVPTVFLLLLGLIVGGARERGHFRRLDAREQNTRDMLATQIKSFPAAAPSSQPPMMVNAECIIATDYLKTFLAGLRNIFGGEVGSYQSLLTRARREATLRILEQARAHGYNAVCNLRLETADVGGNVSQRQRGAVMVAILASATAYHAQGPVSKPV